MPKALDLYGCSYNCGFESKYYDKVEEHEETCAYNPDYKYYDLCNEINNRWKLNNKGICGKYLCQLEENIGNHIFKQWNKCDKCLKDQRLIKELLKKHTSKNM